jgi:hypothetical protein
VRGALEPLREHSFRQPREFPGLSPEEPGRNFNDLVTGIRSDVRGQRHGMEGSQDLSMLMG